MKIKTKINVQKEVDIEIKIPYFCKSANGLMFYKVLNEDGDNIGVTNYGFSTRIEFSELLYEQLIFDTTNTEIKESEFNEAFERAMEILKNK